MTYFMQPEVMNANLREGLGRWIPAIPELTKTDPFLAGSVGPAPRALCARGHRADPAAV